MTLCRGVTAAENGPTPIAGGTLNITSTPGDGTRVFGRIALRPSAAP